MPALRSQRPSVTEVARACGVSPSTVCRALNAAAHIPVQPELIGGPFSGRDLYEYGRRETAAALSRIRFDALFAVNDAAAIGALRALRDAGLRTPQDVAVIGFDDIMAAAHAAPPLTTVAQPKEQMAMACVHLLQQRRQHPATPCRHLRLAPELRLRESA